MPQSKVNDAQAQVEEILHAVGNGGAAKVPPGVIQEILQIIGKATKKMTPMTKALLQNDSVREIIKLKMMDLGPTEWKKKAQLAAMLLSQNLEE